MHVDTYVHTYIKKKSHAETGNRLLFTKKIVFGVDME